MIKSKNTNCIFGIPLLLPCSHGSRCQSALAWWMLCFSCSSVSNQWNLQYIRHWLISSALWVTSVFFRNTHYAYLRNAVTVCSEQGLGASVWLTNQLAINEPKWLDVAVKRSSCRLLWYFKLLHRMVINFPELPVEIAVTVFRVTWFRWMLKWYGGKFCRLCRKFWGNLVNDSYGKLENEIGLPSINSVL